MSELEEDHCDIVSNFTVNCAVDIIVADGGTVAAEI
jgi:hypothetical protein